MIESFHIIFCVCSDIYESNYRFVDCAALERWTTKNERLFQVAANFHNYFTRFPWLSHLESNLLKQLTFVLGARMHCTWMNVSINKWLNAHTHTNNVPMMKWETYFELMINWSDSHWKRWLTLLTICWSQKQHHIYKR